MIDHEEYKYVIKVSKSIINVLNQDSFEFGLYYDINNLNRFINVILPKIYNYRNKLFETNIGKFNELISLYVLDNPKRVDIEDFVDSLNDIYYDDPHLYHDYVLNFRLSKENIQLLGNKVNEKNKKSTFIRTLINQYTSLPKDQRIYLLFNKMYDLIGGYIETKCWIRVDLINNAKIIIYPIDIVTCPVDSQIYIIGIDKTPQMFSARICDIANVQCMENINDKIELSEYEEQLNRFYDDFMYIDFSKFIIDGV